MVRRLVVAGRNKAQFPGKKKKETVGGLISVYT